MVHAAGRFPAQSAINKNELNSQIAYLLFFNV